MNKIAEQSPAVRVDFSENSDKLFIAFGSLRLERDVPPFEYVSAFRNLPVKKILIRDLHKIYYLRGLPGISTDVLGTRDYLQDIRMRESISKLVIFGGSAGAYAALLMGWLLGADEVHAFAPITFLPSRKGLNLLGLVLFRRRWRLLSKQLQLIGDPRLNHGYYDLKSILCQDNGKTSYNIYYGIGRKQDRNHCRRMNGLPGVQLLEYDYDKHHISYFLRERGNWLRIFQEAI